MRMSFVAIASLTVSLALTSMLSAQTIKSGIIHGKSVEWTTGSVRIVKYSQGHEIQLAGDFKTKKGPSLWVYLGNKKPEKRIAKLNSVIGAQTYVVPSSINPESYSKLFIHCVPFNATFGSAMLN